MVAGLRKLLGYVLYWIGWGLAVLVIAQAIILSTVSGSPLIPMLLGGTGVIVWLIVVGFRNLLR